MECITVNDVHFKQKFKGQISEYGKEFKTNCKSVSDNQVPLTMRDVFMPFITLACALAISFMILFLEKFQSAVTS